MELEVIGIMVLIFAFAAAGTKKTTAKTPSGATNTQGGQEPAGGGPAPRPTANQPAASPTGSNDFFKQLLSSLGGGGKGGSAGGGSGGGSTGSGGIGSAGDGSAASAYPISTVFSNEEGSTITTDPTTTYGATLDAGVGSYTTDASGNRTYGADSFSGGAVYGDGSLGNTDPSPGLGDPSDGADSSAWDWSDAGGDGTTVDYGDD